MATPTSLKTYLQNWAENDAARIAIAGTLQNIARACSAIAEDIARSPQPRSAKNAAVEFHAQPPAPAYELIRKALREAPVAFAASATNGALAKLKRGAPLAITFHPLDSLTNLQVEAPAGSLFSVYTASGDPSANTADTFRPCGLEQLAAGFVLYGPHTTLVFTTGDGVNFFTLDLDRTTFRLTRAGARIPVGSEHDPIKLLRQVERGSLVADELDAPGAGPDQDGDGTHWTDSLAAEAYRILIQGGVFMSLENATRPLLVFEANPVALLIEQAGGTAHDGEHRVLEIVPQALHQRVPIVFGATRQVERVTLRQGSPDAMTSHSPLFRKRDLFRN